ncbi:anthrax toxin lethal factor-related metalloendopeptidase [Blautia sp.]|uniref:anthrax toxin lethal factor-related metalloendopeptidase n=1 Tax=Blautia sp. TaxID=1955243 RepID=UPI003AB849F1
MKKMNLKNFFMKKKIAAGCIAAAALITAGSFAMVWQDSQVPELPNYTDPVVEQTIEDDDTPLASQPKVTTKTTKRSKTTKKNIKLKAAATKTYTKKLPTTKKTTNKTTKKNRTTTIKTTTTVQTDTSQKYTKKSKNVVQTQKVTTTVQTTTTVVAAASTTVNATTAGSTTAKKEKYTVSNVASIAPQMDSRVLNAFTKMGFTVIVDPSVSYAGYFDGRSRTITLKVEDDTIYHELGHYLAFIAGNVDKNAAFASVYNSEKSKFTGVRKAYATQNASEYFAESVLEYTENPSVLKAQRPQTYEAITNALSKVTDAQVNKIMNVYKVIWK